MTAFSTPVSIGVELSNPLLDTGLGELQINQQATQLLDLLNTFLLASWASYAFDVNDSVGTNLRSLQHTVPLVDGLELAMCSQKHLLTLVIKVSTFGDMFEVI